MLDTPAITSALVQVGPRLKRLREQRGITLAALAETTGISKSTLSRLESGQRRPNLELLLPIARAHQVSLDELVAAPQVDDPRVNVAPRRVGGRTLLPLTRHPGGPQPVKITIPASQDDPDLRIHAGYEWLYVLSGRLRLVLADHDLILGPGEAAEFHARLPHWLGSTGGSPAEILEILSLLGRGGERTHVHATAAPSENPRKH